MPAGVHRQYPSAYGVQPTGTRGLQQYAPYLATYIQLP